MTTIDCESRLERVVLYARGAVVTRRVSLPAELPEGPVELCVPRVTALAEAGSLRALVEGEFMARNGMARDSAEVAARNALSVGLMKALQDELDALRDDPSPLDAWLARWQARCAQEPAAGRAQRLRDLNPWIIPRNHRVEEALAAASEHDDLGPFERLLAALRRPFDESPAVTRYAEPAPPQLAAGYQTFCGT